jgi:uncharacterized protein (DUF58 family)
MNFSPENIREFGNLEFLARQVVEGFITGLHKSPYHGFSVEFAEHRLYNKGESTRHIDWKLYARTDKLFVKRYEEETNLRCRIVIDNSSSMYFPLRKKVDFEKPNKILFSVYAAAALMNILKRQRDAVGLSLFAEDIQLHTPERTNTRHHRLLYHELEKLLEGYDPDQKQETFAVQALHQIAEQIHKRSLVVLFTDMFDAGMEDPEELFSALQHLKYNKHEVILFHVVDKKSEIDLDLENRPYKFVDLETGESVKLNPSEIRKEYVERIAQFEQELKMRCLQYKIDLVEVDINKGFELKRQKLY